MSVDTLPYIPDRFHYTLHSRSYGSGPLRVGARRLRGQSPSPLHALGQDSILRTQLSRKMQFVAIWSESMTASWHFSLSVIFTGCGYELSDWQVALLKKEKKMA